MPGFMVLRSRGSMSFWQFSIVVFANFAAIVSLSGNPVFHLSKEAF